MALKNHESLKVGITLAIGLIAFSALFFIIGTQTTLFLKTYRLKIFVPNIEGLSAGAMVTLGGLKIGEIDGFEFAEIDGANGVIINLNIIDDYRNKITAKSVATVQTMGMLGDKYIDVSLSAAGEAPLGKGDFIKMSLPVDLMAVVADAQTKLSDVSATFASLGSLIDSISSGRGTIGKLLHDPELYDNISALSRQLASMASWMNNRNGSLARVINDTILYARLSNTVNNLNDFAEELRSGRGSLGRLIKDDSLYMNINELARRGAALLAKTGTKDNFLGNIINDNELYVQLNALIRDLKDLIVDINNNPKKYFKVSVF